MAFKIFLIFNFIHSFLMIFVMGQSRTVKGDHLRWEALTPFTTTNGDPCVTPCEYRGESYQWCYTMPDTKAHVGTHGKWGYCSSKPGQDYQGNSCHSPCQPHSNYFFCYTDEAKRNWNYCGQTLASTDVTLVGQHKTRYGKYCVSECKKGNSDNNWCYVEDQLKVQHIDYCSAVPGFDISGKKCSSTCDFHERKGWWCHLEEGGWNYCGGITVSSLTQYTYLGSKCITPCRPKDGDDEDPTKNFCYDAMRKQKQCSRVATRAANNMACFNDCSTFHCEGGGACSSKSYNWCWTSNDESSWSFCSSVKENWSSNMGGHPGCSKAGKYYPRSDIDRGLTRTGNQSNVYRYQDDLGRNRVTFFEELEGNGLSQIGGDVELQNHVLECLSSWKRKRFNVSVGQSHELARARRIRLFQRTIYKDPTVEEKHVKLELQINHATTAAADGFPTIAEVEVAVKLVKDDPELVVDALLDSMEKGKPIHMGRFHYTNTATIKNDNSDDELDAPASSSQ